MKIKVEKIAKELLLEEDCVVIPEFGGFVSSYRAAIVEPSKNILLPPGKHISFNAKLSKNDGLLAKSISEKLGVSYNDALKSIEVRVEFWRNELETKHYLEFEDLGSFILNKEGNLVFEQFNETNFLDTSFGLTNVHAIPVERVGLTQKIERGLANKQAQPRTLKVMYGVAAASVLMFGIFTAAWQQKTGGLDNALNFFSFSNNPIEQNDQVQSDIVVGQSTIKNTEVVATKPLEVAQIDKIFNKEEKQLLTDLGHIGDEVNIERVNSLKLEKETRDKVFTESTTTTKAVDFVPEEITSSSTKGYHVIAGCFGVKNNAHKMVRSLKAAGYPAELAGKSNSGLYRVAYGSYSSRVKALKALAKAKLSHNSKAWIAKD